MLRRPSALPKKVIDYLGRYTHRVAISHHRLVAVEHGQVSFRWRDYRQGNQVKVMTLEPAEFIRCFLLHTLPPRTDEDSTLWGARQSLPPRQANDLPTPVESTRAAASNT